MRDVAGDHPGDVTALRGLDHGYHWLLPLPRIVARFNRLFTNRLFGPLASVTPPFTIVVHRGRRSRREYRTPVWAFRTNDGFVIPLTYRGSRTEWAANVLAAGRAKLVARQRSTDVVRPRIIHGQEGIAMIPGVFRPPLRLLRVDDFLVFDAVS